MAGVTEHCESLEQWSFINQLEILQYCNKSIAKLTFTCYQFGFLLLSSSQWELLPLCSSSVPSPPPPPPSHPGWVWFPLILVINHFTLFISWAILCLVVSWILQVDGLLRSESGQVAGGVTARVTFPMVTQAKEGFCLGQEVRIEPVGTVQMGDLSRWYSTGWPLNL